MAPVFLGRLQSGFLLFETQQGVVRVELSFWQRVYLLWTFRNFRQLSIPLLNSRQRALVYALFPNNTSVASNSRDPLLVIGVVEDFVPAPAMTSASPTQKRERQEVKKAVAPRTEIAPSPKPTPRPWPRIAWSRLATIVGVLSLCVVSVAAWHRIQGVGGSQAQSQPRLERSNATAPSASEKLAAVDQAVSALPPSANYKGVVQSALISVERGASRPAVSQERTSLRFQTLPPEHAPDGIQASRPPLRFVYPVYPAVNARGVVALTAQVDADGKVRTVQVLSGNRALAAAAVRAVRQWHYRPYLKDDQPVATETNIVISFISDEAISMTFPPSLPASH
ncbi:MAG: energy transducer TonB [Acidobacteriia bacterium]|nr:energy transducer TonB [Terriglobia bacterium]